MKTAAIIAEYNPFHRGHAYQIAQTRQLGATHIAVIMSGDFVQRADAAILPKRVRARLAVENGADLVIELDTAHATATAEHFAKGALYLADALGCVDALSFGCETDDLSALEQLAALVDQPDVSAILRSQLADGKSFAAARAQAVALVGGREAARLLKMPNAILATEYLRAIRSGGYQITPWIIQRQGAGHDHPAPLAGTASASFLRTQMQTAASLEGMLAALTPYLPSGAGAAIRSACEAGQAPAALHYAERAVLSRLRRFTAPAELTRYFDVGEGLENRLYSAIAKACSLEELYALIKSKRYSHARIRRMVLQAFLDIEGSLLTAYPSYLRPLALNQRGAEILRQARLPVISRYADLAAFYAQGCPFAHLARRASRLYTLCTPQIGAADAEEITFPHFIRT